MEASSPPPGLASPPWRSLLYCCRRRHNSLYRRNNLGYSPSKACFRKDEAGERERESESKKRGQCYSVVLMIATHSAQCKKQNTLTHMNSNRIFVTIWLCRVREFHNSNCPWTNARYLLLRRNYWRTWISFVKTIQNKIAVLILDDIALYSHKTVRIPWSF